MSRPTREQMEEQLVELVQTGSAAEADALATNLRQRGIIAVANAEELRPNKRRRDMEPSFRTFVLVHQTDLDAAVAVMDEVLRAEGDVPEEHIRAEMRAAEEDLETATAWYYEQPRLRQKPASMFAMAVIIGVIAVIAWVLMRNYR